MFLFDAIRSLLGWSNEKINFPNEGVVSVYSHTSFLDILPVFLYLDQFYETGYQPILIVKDKWYTRILNFFFDIAIAPSIHAKRSGGVDLLYQQIQDKIHKKKFIIPISPKGTIKKSEWRTGYYYLAKKLKCKICVITPDFTRRCVVTSPTLYDPNNYKSADLENVLKYVMSKTGVLNIENADHNNTNFYCCPYESCLPFDFCIVSLGCFIPYLYLVFTRTQNYLLQFSSLFCTYYSTVYHMNNEYRYLSDKNKADWLKAKEKYLVQFVILLQLYETFSIPNAYKTLELLPLVVSFVVGIFFYFNAMPTEHMKPRNKYALFHGFFHVCASIFMMLLVRDTNSFSSVDTNV